MAEVSNHLMVLYRTATSSAVRSAESRERKSRAESERSEVLPRQRLLPPVARRSEHPEHALHNCERIKLCPYQPCLRLFSSQECGFYLSGSCNLSAVLLIMQKFITHPYHLLIIYLKLYIYCIFFNLLFIILI